MNKLTTALILISLVIFIYGLNYNVNINYVTNLKNNENNIHLDNNVKIKGNTVVFVLDNMVCSVCVTNVYDYINIIKEYYNNKVNVMVLVDESISEYEMERLKIMLTHNQPVIKSDFEKFNISTRTMIFVSHDNKIYGVVSLSSNNITDIKTKKIIVNQGVSLFD